MQNGNHENRVFSSAINDDRHCQSGRARRWFGRTALPASKAFSETRPRDLTPDVFSITASMVGQ